LLVVDADDFFASPAEHYDRVRDFLGLAPFTPDSFDQHNARPSAPMPAPVRARLRESFAASDEALAAYLPATPSWRR
jgi:hypothetical protein